MVNVQRGLLEFIRDGGNHHQEFSVEAAQVGNSSRGISRLLVQCGEHGWMDGWMGRIHVLGSSPDPFLLVFTWQFCCSGAVPFLLCRCFSCSCAGFVPSLEAGLTPTVMARFWMVGGGLEVFELGDLK